MQFLSFYANGNAATAAPGDAARLAELHANLFSTDNISSIEEAWDTHGLAGMVTVDGVWLWHTNPSTKQREGGLRPGWRAHLQSVLAQALPLVRKGAVRGFFLGDELCCTQGVPGSNVSSVASIIRHTLDSQAELASSGALGPEFLGGSRKQFHKNKKKKQKSHQKDMDWAVSPMRPISVVSLWAWDSIWSWRFPGPS